jgi:hypothetical protein
MPEGRPAIALPRRVADDGASTEDSMPATTTAAPAPADPDATVRTETLANTAITVVLAAAIAWLMFRGQSQIEALAPPPGGIFGIVPGTFNFTLLVTIVLTLVIRGRVRRGRAQRWPAGRPLPATWLPRNVVLRGLAFAAAMTLTLVPATFLLVRGGIAAGVLPAAWPFGAMLALFCAYFGLLAYLVTPPVVRRALAD